MRKFKLPADLKEDAIKNLDPNQTTNRRSCGPLLRFDFNDSGNASKFLEWYKDDVLYDPFSKQWFVYKEGRWMKDAQRVEIRKLAQELYETLDAYIQREYDDVRNYNKAAVKKLNDAERNLVEQRRARYLELSKGVKKLGNNRTQDDMFKTVQTRVAKNSNIFNPDSTNHLLVVKNGTVNLRTGELRPHSREDYSTMRIDIDYDPHAGEPTGFIRFLNQVFEGNAEIIGYVKRLLGYCLTGETRLQAFHFLLGLGGNGKGVLLNLIEKIFGEYCFPLDLGALDRRSNSNNPNSSLFRAKRCRCVILTESNVGARPNSGLIKQLTGGDTISSNTTSSDDDRFKPHFKLLWSVNDIPSIDLSDYGMYRRYRKISFKVSFRENPDESLKDTLFNTEKVKILKFLIDGAVDYYKNGLSTIPEVMEDEIEQDRRDLDSIYAFYTDMIEPADNDTGYQATVLYEAYRNYCRNHEFDNPKSMKKFGQTICNVYGVRRVSRSSANYYVGIRIRNLRENESSESDVSETAEEATASTGTEVTATETVVTEA